MTRKRSRSAPRVPARPSPPPAPPAWVPRAPSRVIDVGLLVVALALVAGTRSMPMWLAAAPERAAFGYKATDGTTYPYLIGMDSYSWVRKAENLLAHGTPCDVETTDGCRDRL